MDEQNLRTIRRDLMDRTGAGSNEQLVGAPSSVAGLGAGRNIDGKGWAAVQQALHVGSVGGERERAATGQSKSQPVILRGRYVNPQPR